MEALQEEWEENCGFCNSRDVLVKTDRCLIEGPVKENWLKCREENLGTRDPTEATDKICKMDREGQRLNEGIFFECYAREGITQEVWLAALSNCEWV